MPLQILAPDFSRHGDDIASLIAETFHEQPTAETVARIRGMASLPDWVQPADCRIGILDGRIVTSVTIFRYLTRIGGARLATAGVGAVATHRDYRKRGLMRQTLDAVVAGLPAAGYDLSVLFGIADFYWQFGYVRGWSDDTVTARTPDLKPVREAPATMEWPAGPLPEDIVACMNHWQESMDGSAVRPTHGAANKLDGDNTLRRCWRAADGAIGGTLIAKLEEERLRIEDACGDPEEVLALVAALCAEHGKAEAVFPLLPYRSPLSRRLRLGECRLVRGCRRNGGALVRTVDLASCLRKLTGDFAARLAASRHHAWHGCLRVGDGRSEAGLHIHGDGVRVAPPVETPHCLAAGDYAASLVMGAEDPADTLSRPEVAATGDAPALARILFPELDPQLPALDRY